MARLILAKNSRKLDVISVIVKSAKRQGLKIVTTNGAFDLIHIGHIRNLEFAKSLGDILIVGINSDKSIQSYKAKNRPIVPENERAEIIAALKSVDYVFIFGEKTPITWLKKLKPDIHVKGNDRNIKQILERDVLRKIGTRFVFAPFIKNKSSTHLIQKILRLNRNT